MQIDIRILYNTGIIMFSESKHFSKFIITFLGVSLCSWTSLLNLVS